MEYQAIYLTRIVIRNIDENFAAAYNIPWAHTHTHPHTHKMEMSTRKENTFPVVALRSTSSNKSLFYFILSLSGLEREYIEWILLK